MANLKDTIVLGNLTVTGKIIGGSIDSGSGGSGNSLDGVVVPTSGNALTGATYADNKITFTTDTFLKGSFGSDTTKYLNNKGEWTIPPDNNTWQQNTASNDGYVTKGSGQIHKVWKTDANGVPGWGDAVLAYYPAGFSGRGSTISWGVLKNETYITRWDTTNGGSVAFAEKEIATGNWQTSMQVDGYFYQSEGANKVLDVTNLSGTAGYIPVFSGTNTAGSSIMTQTVTTDSEGKDVKRIYIGGKLIVNPAISAGDNSYNEGIRICPASNGWSEICFAGDTATSGQTTGWIAGMRGAKGTYGQIGDFTIEYNGSGGSGLTLPSSNSNRPMWNGKELAFKEDLSNPEFEWDQSFSSIYANNVLPLYGDGTSNIGTPGASWYNVYTYHNYSKEYHILSESLVEQARWTYRNGDDCVALVWS